MLRDLFNNMGVVTKNLFLLCILMFIVQKSGENAFNGDGISSRLGLYYFDSPNFQPFQIITHMFCHGNFPHLLFNMLGLVTIGGLLERVWGPKRFLIFYLSTGLGAMLIHQAATAYDIYKVVGSVTADLYGSYSTIEARTLAESYYAPVLGASGAIYGLLIALAMLFPNIELMFLFFPVPIKAKYLVPVFVIIEVFLGMSNYQTDNIAHFAHLGGALFGFILIKIWSRDRSKFY